MQKVQFEIVCSISQEQMNENRAYATSLNLPPPKASAEKLAIVGGGGSVARHIEELRAWNGPVWAINGAARWCIDHLIECTLVTASPAVWPESYVAGVTKAILANTCHQSTFDALKGRDVCIYDAGENGPTSSCAAIILAAELGFRDISLFGCESAYGQETHLYQNTPNPSEIAVCAGGANYRTQPDYFIQAQVLSALIIGVPQIFKDRSGGLLSALVADPEHWAVKTSSELKDAA